MLELQSWLPLADQVPNGHSRRLNHVCGPGRTLKIERRDNELWAYCHRCADSGFHKTRPTAAELAARRAAVREGDATLARVGPGVAVELPAPAVHDVREWPAGAFLWLAKAGLGAFEIRRLGAYYHPPSDRVVLPCFRPGTGHPAYWQARAYDGRLPKYMGSPVGRASCVPHYGNGGHIAVTEDILSAFKIGLVSEAVCALGTSPSSALVRLLLGSGKRVSVWLDPDPAGRRGATKLTKALRAYGIPAGNILSARDPKLHSREQIKEYMK